MADKPPVQAWTQYPTADTGDTAAAAPAAPAWSAYPVVDHPDFPVAKAEGSVAGPPAPGIAEDIAKAVPSGIARGMIGMAGMGGDVRGLMSTAADKLGMSDTAKNIVGDVATGIGALNPLTATTALATRFGPSSGDITNQIEQATGPLYQAKTTPGQYAQRGGEFLPAAFGGEGSFIARLIRQALIPAAASETAGQLSPSSVAPYTRLAAAIAGGAVGPVAERIGAARAAAAATPSIAEVRNAATAGFTSPAVRGVTFTPGTMSDVSNIITTDLGRAGLNERLAPQTHAILEEMHTPVNGIGHTMEDVQTTRQLLGDVAGNFSNPTEQRAATQAIRALDTTVGALPQIRAATGDIPAANQALTDARANYASQATAQRVQDKLTNADLRAASTYSGGNVNNATRQNLRTLLTNRAQRRGLTPDELQTIEDTVRGSTAGNVLRATGKILGGGGGLATLHTAGAGAIAGNEFGGPLGALIGATAPVAGYGLKRLGDAITQGNANSIVRQILQRSPLGVQQAPALPPVTPGPHALLRQLLLANQSMIPSRQPAPAIANPQQ